ncbi:trehalose-phosphatase [Modestobacter sp. L9-4]|uniref:trehalose-phosphatase n=1 Tax=Modestobacter sp. L9-4 TaxID=2851567 RepID=UPI001C750136|nr:trehalose-phosphatase [Modestobacter sp. L9-4]QXG74264.1 trehalose-phosphatase [Modestobacter sp. L9-4]
MTDLGGALADLARQRPLLVASDYDGVLARLRDDPGSAVPEPGVADLLTRLAAVEGVTVALVSGRGVADLQATSGLTGPFRWVGSHGAEFDGPLSGDLAVRRDELVAALAPLVAAVPGARLEVKPAGAAVHVRTVTDRDAAARLLADAAAGPGADPSLTAKPGKDVLELAVTDADKGSALLRLRDELGATGVLYLGDDVTDEDGFTAIAPDGLSVKVGDGDTAARHRVPDLDGVRDLLARLAELLAP